jgi:hypothetical protein
MVITTDKTEMPTGNNSLHGAGKGFQIYLAKFAGTRVRTGTGDERRKAKKSDGVYQQCDITIENDIPRIKEQCLSDSQVIILPASRRKLLDLFNFDCYQPS